MLKGKGQVRVPASNEDIREGSRRIADIGLSREVVEDRPDQPIDCLGFMLKIRVAQLIHDVLARIDGPMIRFVVDNQKRQVCNKLAAGFGIDVIGNAIADPMKQAL